MSSVASATSSPPPTVFEATSEPPASTAPSSPPPEDILNTEKMRDEDVIKQDDDQETRLRKLQHVLTLSTAYSKMLQDAMAKHRSGLAKQDTTEPVPTKDASKAKGGRSSKRNKRIMDDSDVETEETSSKRQKTSHGDPTGEKTVELDASCIVKQPSLITGAKLKDYQLEGLQWMVSLHLNGISGILADEMGLGKTLQTISFTAYLREITAHPDPILIVCPLSVVHNWIDEYKKFAPEIPVLMYLGTPDERAELRRSRMPPLPPKTRPAAGKTNDEETQPTVTPAKRTKRVTRGKGRTRGGGRGRGRGRGRGGKKIKEEEDEEDEAPAVKLDDDDSPEVVDAYKNFPIVITSYDYVMRDANHLGNYNWGYIVVDEGHRLKNMDCKLMQELKKYDSACRMVLTGTPLQNNLAELWSLLNFVIPGMFGDAEAFQEWFNFNDMSATLGSEQAGQLVHSLHTILKPFLLRRLKVDVEQNLPPKKEYVLYAPLSATQREAYDRILDGTMRSWLMKEKGNKELMPAEPKMEVDDGPRKLRSHLKGRKTYVVDGDDDEYFDMLERGEVDERGFKQPKKAEKLAELNKLHRMQLARKKVNNMKLQNTVMQLRKACSHPFIFDWPIDPETNQEILNDDLVAASGKMMVLDRLLTELFRQKHKVLLFSQFTTMLDIIEDWAVELKGWKICRIDGSTKAEQRRAQMHEFQTAGDSPDAPILFLLSTRAGGQGINLTAADTVIFYDQDWNPQTDAQAQDRAHRIGQTKPVLIFRLVSGHTIETNIMQRATEKRQLEALVIAKGKFRTPAAAAAASRGKETMAEMAAALLKLEADKIEVVPNTTEGRASVISDTDLEMLLDRSPEVFSDRGKGWTSADGKAGFATADSETGKKAAFAVYERPGDGGNDALAQLLGESSDDD
ncbi:putative ATPase [Paramarasmius palmivorus]|uniref:ATPase n=1 Tax=Paramarasmius palmivorus TaxID=297713 RepID=A0AAW0DB14_9AGAR